MFDPISKLESKILSILANKYPLTANEILEKIENHYSSAGIHRALLALLQQGLIHKSKTRYQLQTDHLIDEKREIQKVLDRYIKAESYHIFQKQESFYYFATLSELDYFWNAVIEKWFNFYPKKRYSYWQKQPLPWFAILQLNEERRVVNNICELTKDFKTVCVDNPITKLLKPVYTEHKNSSFHPIKDLPSIGHAFAIFGDHVIETFHNKKTEKVIKQLCKSKSSSLLFESVIELAEPGSYKLEISKDPKKADSYKQKIKKWLS